MDIEKGWLEPVLARHLSRAKAPEELWEKLLQPARHDLSAPPRPGAFYYVLAAALPLLAVIFAASRPAEITSSDPTQIQAWVKAHADLDVPLPAVSTSNVRLSGARLLKGPAAEVRYSVGSREARIVISKADSDNGDRKHRFLSNTSWTMGGQRYTVASTDSAVQGVACRLCHAGA